MVLRAAVEPIGLREKLTLELKGDVLVCHGRGWSQSYTVYIPSECMNIEANRRRDGRFLIRGFMLPLVLLLLLIGGMLLGQFGFGARMETLLWYGVPMVLLTLLSFVYTGYSILRFLPKRNTVRLRVQSEESGGIIEFWHDPGKDLELDRLVGRLFELERRDEDKVPFPLRMSYTWHHVRPLRAIIVAGFGGMFALWILVWIVKQVWQWIKGVEMVLSPWFFTIFLLPWIWSLGQYLIAVYSMRNEPDDFRLGIKQYDQGEFARAEENFRRTLEIVPRHVPSLYLLIQLCAYRYEFDDAFKFCAQLEPFAPEEAENLQQELWTLKRLVARME
jgi:hypothetical protein